MLEKPYSFLKAYKGVADIFRQQNNIYITKSIYLSKINVILLIGCENGEVLELDVKNPVSLINSIHASNSPVISLLSLGKTSIEQVTFTLH